LKETRAMFRQEQHIPSAVIDRGAEASHDTFARAGEGVDELVAVYEAPVISEDVLREFEGIVEREAERAGCAVGL